MAYIWHKDVYCIRSCSEIAGLNFNGEYMERRRRECIMMFSVSYCGLEVISTTTTL